MPKANGRDDVFETSDCPLENDDSDHSMGHSSAISLNEVFEKAWAKLPEGANDIFTQPAGILYIERYESFIKNSWPYHVKKGNLCHPRALALAGLGFYSLEPTPSAQCVVCLKILDNLKPNSNPWVLHSGMNPECYTVQLGQRDKVDDYTMCEIVEMVFRRNYNEVENKLNERTRNLKRQLYSLAQHEKKVLQTNNNKK